MLSRAQQYLVPWCFCCTVSTCNDRRQALPGGRHTHTHFPIDRRIHHSSKTFVRIALGKIFPSPRCLMEYDSYRVINRNVWEGGGDFSSEGGEGASSLNITYYGIYNLLG